MEKKFPNLPTVLHPLNILFKADVKWQWSEEGSKAFETTKQLLVKAEVLDHFDTDLPCVEYPGWT